MFPIKRLVSFQDSIDYLEVLKHCCAPTIIDLSWIGREVVTEVQLLLLERQAPRVFVFRHFGETSEEMKLFDELLVQVLKRLDLYAWDPSNDTRLLKKCFGIEGFKIKDYQPRGLGSLSRGLGSLSREACARFVATQIPKKPRPHRWIRLKNQRINRIQAHKELCPETDSSDEMAQLYDLWKILVDEVNLY